MADKRISELTAANAVGLNDLFVMEQANEAKKVSGRTFQEWLVRLATGLGSIESISIDHTEGLVDYYKILFTQRYDPQGQDTTVYFTVTNGARGQKGDTGATGAQGPKGDNITITSTSVRYRSDTQGRTPPTGSTGWETNPPAVAGGNYLWTRTIVTYSDSTSVTSYSVARMGIDGSGAVSSVCNVLPDGNGNVALNAATFGAVTSVCGVSPDAYGDVLLGVSDIGDAVATVCGVSPGANGNVVITASTIGAATVTDGKVTASQASSAISTKTADYTLVLADAGKMIMVNSSNDCLVTIPANSSVAFPIGTEIEIAKLGTGAVTIDASSGVTIDSLDSMTDIAGQYATVAIKKIATNEWLLVGALG